MTTDPAWIKVDPAGIDHVLRRDAVKQLSSTSELVLDFSAVLRIDANALKALEELAHQAGEKSVKIALRAVHLDVYKVLKLARLTPRFSFLP